MSNAVPIGSADRPFDLRPSPFWILALSATVLNYGCSGHAVVHTIPLGVKQINTTGPLLLLESLSECYYWINDQNALCVAMRKNQGSIFGRLLERELVLSFVLPGLPAATSRDYRMDQSTARLISRSGLGHQRGGSLNGILTVWNYGKGRLRGRFRFTAKQQSYSVLTGWSGNYQSLYLGDFAAVEDRVRGEKLLARSEEGGLTRGSVAPVSNR